MNNTPIEGQTHVLGEQQGYKPLRVRKTPITDQTSKAATFLYESAWEPSPLELQLIMRGAKVHVGILSSHQPPIKVTVGPAPDEGQGT